MAIWPLARAGKCCGLFQAHLSSPWQITYTPILDGQSETLAGKQLSREVVRLQTKLFQRYDAERRLQPGPHGRSGACSHQNFDMKRR